MNGMSSFEGVLVVGFFVVGIDVLVGVFVNDGIGILLRLLSFSGWSFRSCCLERSKARIFSITDDTFEDDDDTVALLFDSMLEVVVIVVVIVDVDDDGCGATDETVAFVPNAGSSISASRLLNLSRTAVFVPTCSTSSTTTSSARQE
jgi:hypothetical protein